MKIMAEIDENSIEIMPELAENPLKLSPESEEIYPRMPSEILQVPSKFSKCQAIFSKSQASSSSKAKPTLSKLKQFLGKSKPKHYRKDHGGWSLQDVHPRDPAPPKNPSQPALKDSITPNKSVVIEFEAPANSTPDCSSLDSTPENSLDSTIFASSWQQKFDAGKLFDSTPEFSYHNLRLFMAAKIRRRKSYLIRRRSSSCHNLRLFTAATVLRQRKKCHNSRLCQKIFKK